MYIKYQQLNQQLQNTIAPLYILTGQEPYFLNESIKSIKASLRKKHDFDEIRYHIQNPEDWNHLLDQANSYSLFSECTLLNVYYDKKTLDTQGKKTLSTYMQALNPQCFILIQAPNVPLKQIQGLSLPQAVLVWAAPLAVDAMKIWVSQQLKINALKFEAQIPALIVQYTEGNMLACAQVIEKIILSAPSNKVLDRAQILEFLSDQSIHSLYELVESCLQGQAAQALHILRQAAQNKTEASLVLWMLAQELRLLLQLGFEQDTPEDFKSKCAQLKIWTQKTNLYYSASQRLNLSLLKQLLYACISVDEAIKSNQNTPVWQALEQLVCSFCLGEQVFHA